MEELNLESFFKLLSPIILFLYLHRWLRYFEKLFLFILIKRSKEIYFTFSNRLHCFFLGGGAVGRLHSPAATAEIEGDEGEVISIDTPTIPQRDIHSLLQEALPLPQTLCQSMQSSLQNASLLQFASRFVSVWEESNSNVSVSDNHVRELLQEYYQKNEDTSQPAADPKHPEDAGGGDTEIVLEKYEKSNPAHGDKMFHHFLSKIQANPGHILR